MIVMRMTIIMYSDGDDYDNGSIDDHDYGDDDRDDDNDNNDDDDGWR